MHLDINSESYTLYDGETPHDVLQKHDENQRSWSFNLFDTRKHKRLKINPFEDMCIGVYIDSSTESGYIMSMTETRKYLDLQLDIPFFFVELIICH